MIVGSAQTSCRDPPDATTTEQDFVSTVTIASPSQAAQRQSTARQWTVVWGADECLDALLEELWLAGSQRAR